MASRPAIIPDMPIFGSDGVLVGTVHRVSGVRIILNRMGVSDADLHIVPLARVAEVTDRVTLDCLAVDAQPTNAGVEAGKRKLVGPLGVLAIGGFGIALVYGVGSLALRGGHKLPPKTTAMAAVVPVAPAAVAEKTRGAIVPAKRSAPVAVLPASAAAVRTFLASDAPAPQRFTLDTVSFAPGSASFDAKGKAAVQSLATMMLTHLNTMIKLSASGGVEQRRLVAVRSALIGYGVADYRIATGASRARGAKSGLEMTILRK